MQCTKLGIIIRCVDSVKVEINRARQLVTITNSATNIYNYTRRSDYLYTTTHNSNRYGLTSRISFL